MITTSRLLLGNCSSKSLQKKLLSSSSLYNIQVNSQHSLRPLLHTAYSNNSISISSCYAGGILNNNSIHQFKSTRHYSLLDREYKLNGFEGKRRYTTSNTSEQKQQESKQQQQQEKKEENEEGGEEQAQTDIGKKKVGKWLLFTAGLVGAMVVVGGITRLTESGLSMTDWKPLVGAIPPLNEQEWEEEFNKYKQYPEYKKLNMGMTLQEFKNIFFWEYSHRLFGRALGIVFAVPFVYYWRKGYIDGSLGRKLALIFTMGGAQGALGWYMVKSGLDEKTIIGDVPRVSQYRLAAHLGSAFVIYTSLLWIGLGLVSPGLKGNVLSKLIANGGVSGGLRKGAWFTSGLIATTVASGAFVAGLDAGLVHNTWPLMNGQWIPDDLINSKINPIWKNIFEHDVMAQFNHRSLAYATYISVLTLTAFAYRGRAGLSRRARLAFNSLAVVATAQVALGITTLLTFVPVELGAAHQAGSLTLLSVAIWLLRELKKIK